MSERKPITPGTRYGRLVVTDEPSIRNPRIQVHAICDCGAKKLIPKTNLVSGKTKSCGCLMRQINAARQYRHGLSFTPTHKSWLGLKERCSKASTDAYKHYGGRGISYDPRWENFDLFFEDMGECPQGHSLDRIDVNGNYTKENCRWATNSQQARNTRVNRMIEYKGAVKCLAEWCQQLGMNYMTVWARIFTLHWSVEKSFETKTSGWNGILK